MLPANLGGYGHISRCSDLQAATTERRDTAGAARYRTPSDQSQQSLEIIPDAAGLFPTWEASTGITSIIYQAATHIRGKLSMRVDQELGPQ